MRWLHCNMQHSPWIEPCAVLAWNCFYFLSFLQVEWLRGDPRTISSWTSFTSCLSLKGMLFSQQKIPLIIFLCLRAQYAETGRVQTRAHTHVYIDTHKHTHMQTLPACCSLVPMPWGGEKGAEGWRGVQYNHLLEVWLRPPRSPLSFSLRNLLTPPPAFCPSTSLYSVSYSGYSMTSSCEFCCLRTHTHTTLYTL